MYPFSLVLDSLRTQAQALRATFEEARERCLEPVRSEDAIWRSRTRVSRYVTAVLGFLGIGFLGVVFLSGLSWNGTAISKGGGPHPLTCQHMTVSLKEGKLFPASEAACQEANIRCTSAMMEKSQLCRDKCAADAP